MEIFTMKDIDGKLVNVYGFKEIYVTSGFGQYLTIIKTQEIENINLFKGTEEACEAYKDAIEKVLAEKGLGLSSKEIKEAISEI